MLIYLFFEELKQAADATLTFLSACTHVSSHQFYSSQVLVVLHV